MLTVHQISKSFGNSTILEAVSFNLNPGERLGLVGPNGCGKTTLLRILAGLDQPDSGTIQLNPPGLGIGFLPQGFMPFPDETIESALAPPEGDFSGLTRQIEHLARELTHTPDRRDLQDEYDIKLSRLENLSERTWRATAILATLGLDDFPLDTPVASLSGGQKTRLALAKVLLTNPKLLLLDEPTNHLDLEMLEWLEDWLLGFPYAALVVSHDRALLDRIATGILELDPRTRIVRQFTGSYTTYLEHKLAERERHWRAYHEQQDEIRRLRSASNRLRGAAKLKRGGKADDGDKFAKGFFGNRSAGTARRAKALEKRLECLMTDERKEKPRSSWQMKLDFGDTPHSGQDVLVLESLSVGYGEKALLCNLNQHLRHGARTVLIGQNGAGKTTLLRTIVGLLPPLGGRVRLGANVRVGYMAQEQENLDQGIDGFTMIRSLAPLPETETRTFLHQFLFSGDDVYVPVSNLSYGERSRLSLACLVVRGCNLLLLDEPINHLDIPSRSRFEQALSTFEGTILVIAHDRYFIEGFATEIWEVRGRGLVRHYRV